MITLTLNVDPILALKIIRCMNEGPQCGGTATTPESAKASSVATPVQALESAAAVAPRPRGRPPKGVVAEPIKPVSAIAPAPVEPIAAPQETAPTLAPAQLATMDKVRAVLVKYNAKFTLVGVSKFLAQFKVKRITDLKPSQYAEVIEQATKALEA